MKSRKILFTLMLLLLFSFNTGHAANPDAALVGDPMASATDSKAGKDSASKPAKEFEVYNLGEVVVSAENARVKEVAVVNEITAEDIKATNSKTLAEALFHAPGVRVTTGAKNAPNVSIHGFAQHRILVLTGLSPIHPSDRRNVLE